MRLNDVVIAFDLDGTLVDTAPDLIGTLNMMLHEAGHPPVPLASARHLVGGGARRLLEHGFEEAGAPFAEPAPEWMVERFVDLYLDRIAHESRPFEGMEAALDELAAEGARFVVCTNKRTDLSVTLLDALGLSSRFEAIVGPDSVSRRKPDPAHLIEALAKAGGRPERALMVGDSENDVLPAKAAGVPVVLVSFGYTEMRLSDLEADALIHGYAELPPVARGLVGRRG